MNNTLSQPQANKLLKTILVVGVGNRLLTDEGVGLYIIDNLLKIPMPSHIHVTEFGCDLLNLLSYPYDPQKIIVVDAIRAGKKTGTIYKFNYDQLETSSAEMSSAHQIRAIDALRLLREVYPGLTDCEIIVIGIEPESIVLGTDLSKSVRDSIAAAVMLVLGELF